VTATAPPTSPAEYGNLPTGAAHEVTVDLEPVRIRVLDRFGAPCANASCDVDTPLLGTRTVTTDGQGWLEIQCPKGTEHVDLKLTDATEDAERCVLLEPPADDDDKQTKRRLLNLGFDGSVDGAAGGDSSSDDSSDGGDSSGSGGSTGPSDPAQLEFLREHGLDTADDDVASRLDRIENDYQTLDDPSQRDLTMLDDQVDDAGDPGERT
jgi:hypothetical protein